MLDMKSIIACLFEECNIVYETHYDISDTTCLAAVRVKNRILRTVNKSRTLPICNTHLFYADRTNDGAYVTITLLPSLRGFGQ